MQNLRDQIFSSLYWEVCYIWGSLFWDSTVIVYFCKFSVVQKSLN